MPGSKTKPAVRRTTVAYQTLHLSGVDYAVLPEDVLVELLRRLHLQAAPAQSKFDGGSMREEDLRGDRLAQKLVDRRKRAGLSQAELARRAGIRVETLNRIERRRTDPDFSTIRKLVTAIDAAEKKVRRARVRNALSGAETE